MIKNLRKIGYIFLILMFLSGIGIVVARAQDGVLLADAVVYLPMLFKEPQGGQSISGRVLSPQSVPLPGVTIRTDHGQSVVTDLEGDYVIDGLNDGSYVLTPSQGGTVFSPSSSSVIVPPNVEKLNFTAQVSCSQVVINSGFEDNSGWEFPVTAYTAGYTTSEKHSGSRSARTGIVNPADNIYSYSSTRQKVSIPSGSTSAYLTFWIKPYSGQVMGQALPHKPDAGASVDAAQMSGDVQYVLILDSNLNTIGTLVWQISNSQTWTQLQFNLVGYAGKTIYLHFGTYNDGYDGISSLFVDDVSLEICPGGPPPPTPPPGPCTNLIRNPGFESSSDWEIPNTAYPAGYSTVQAHSGARSMRTGILNLGENKYSYSDFRQAVPIPYGAAVAKASFWLYTLSGETKSMSQLEAITPTGRPFEQTVLSGDLQYVLILDRYQNWIDTLVWQRTAEGYWHYYEFDLRRYAGQKIYLQFGTYNDGYNGITSMFVDDVSLSDCPATPTPPPGQCQELIVNNNFDSNNGWIILKTNYPAAYSNAQYHSPFRSMRTGITNSADNTYSYSDFRQVVSIPSNANHVTLNMWVYPQSSGTTLGSLPMPERTQFFGLEPMADDSQYLLVLDQNQYWIDTLLWMRSNSQVWTNNIMDLKEFAGRTIMLQWGTYNNGTGGISSMFVDDVSLQACP
ncbi:MAG: carboxypeptidase regulatory-like domain-containing protein [Anaerolineae bacterium]|nr:carboxypeptidase regulatory-like domain-containing protein [Anaerolineae bacterium]